MFLMGLLLPVLGGIFYYVNNNNSEYTDETINTLLQLSSEVFEFSRRERTQTLLSITTSLTWDYGFRSAYATRDSATIYDASLNVLERSLGSVDMLMIADLDYNVVIDTETQGFNELNDEWAGMLDAAEFSDEGITESVVMIEEDPYQMIVVPLYLPRQVAWIIGGFKLGQEFVERVKGNTLSEVSILRLEDSLDMESGETKVIATTLGQRDQELLQNSFTMDSGIFERPQSITLSDGEYSSFATELYRSEENSLRVIAVFQRSYNENSENVQQFRALLIQFYLLVFVVAMIAVLFLARSITRPVAELANTVRSIENGDYGKSVRVDSRDEIGQLGDSVNAMARGLLEKEKVRDLLGKVVSPEIAEQLLNNPVELGGEEKFVTVMFVDIMGFTSYCEGRPPKEVLSVLNQFLSKISNIVEAHNGVVDKYNGDAVMALFGAPVSSSQDTKEAIAATLEIVSVIGEETASQNHGGISARVGVHTGLVVAGNLGSDNRMNYSVIGDTVNLAARLESLTRLYAVSNIVSEAAMLAAPEFSYRELDVVRVFGKTEAVRIYEVLPSDSSATSSGSLQDTRTVNSRFNQAVAHYRQREWDQARSLFEKLVDDLGNPALCSVYLERIESYEKEDPGADWDGVYTFGKK